MRPGYPPGLDPNPTGSKEHWIPTVQAPGVVMVGLSGHRGVGKSTLARGLATELDAVTCPIQVKWFRKKPDQMTGKQAGCVNPEMPESIDFDELCDYLDRIKEALLIRQKNAALEKPSQRRPAPIIVVVEGFLLFYDKKVCERLHVHLWVNGDRKTCLERQVVKNILAGAETGLDVASIENVFSEMTMLLAMAQQCYLALSWKRHPSSSARCWLKLFGRRQCYLARREPLCRRDGATSPVVCLADVHVYACAAGLTTVN